MLSTMVPLSAHDIDEILCEQTVTRRRFGDIALSLGLCRPEHVWEAWLGQLAVLSSPPLVNLETFGIDSQAASLSNVEVSERLRAIPVRIFENIVLVAIASDSTDEQRTEAITALSAHLRRDVRLVAADQNQIRQAISKYYAC